MKSPLRRNLAMTFAFVAGSGMLLLSACASLAPQEVREEPGYYYGWGSGFSTSEAAIDAKKDLIAEALTMSRERDGVKGRIDVTPEMIAFFDLPNLKVYAQDKTQGAASVVYRIKASEWDAFQTGREKSATAEIIPRIAELSAESGSPLADRLVEAAALLDRLNREALADILRETGPESPLVADILNKTCADILSGLSVRMDIQRGFVDKDTVFSGRFIDASGRTPGAMPLRAEWAVRGGDPVVETARSAPDGSFVLKLPSDERFLDRSVRLSVSTGISEKAYGTSALRQLEADSRSEYSYQCFKDVKAYFSAEARIPGGSFTVGAPARDKRAARSEAPREAAVEDFYMDKYLVTNALYAMYLGDTKAESFPEYWENPEYNQDDQPVIGVSYDDAVKFAAWLSEQLGVRKRLPTEAEWERAARGGLDVIYPWGDAPPNEGAFANYNGNGTFAGVSPVGCYEDGKNAYGLYDMAGNVWQWTSTPRDAAKGIGSMIVKGGSWMDGPSDLRISNRRDLDARSGYADVGIRLIREVAE